MIRVTVDLPREVLPLEFAKMAGAGNDFIMIDNRSGNVVEPEALCRRICTRRLSAGADGLILVESSESASFRMLYYNADGSRADFCANGTRCAARFAQLAGIAAANMTIETDAGIIPAVVDDQTVTLLLPPSHSFRPSRPLEIGEETIQGSSIVVGVPHYVTFPSADLWRLDIVPRGRLIRQHPELLPNGANVNFVAVRNRHAIEVRTYERGVEDETLSCGSGVVASVSVSALFGRVESPVSILTRSGATLEVSFTLDPNAGSPQIENLRLTGDARLIYRSRLTAETIEGFDPEWVRNPTVEKGAP